MVAGLLQDQVGPTIQILGYCLGSKNNTNTKVLYGPYLEILKYSLHLGETELTPLKVPSPTTATGTQTTWRRSPCTATPRTGCWGAASARGTCRRPCSGSSRYRIQTTRLVGQGDAYFDPTFQTCCTIWILDPFIILFTKILKFQIFYHFQGCYQFLGHAKSQRSPPYGEKSEKMLDFLF